MSRPHLSGRTLLVAAACIGALVHGACGGDDEPPSVDLSALNVRACDAPVDAERACDDVAAGTWRPVGVCLDVDVEAASRRICDQVRFHAARPSLSGEVSFEGVTWDIDLRWSLDVDLRFPAACLEENELTCREIAGALERTVSSLSVCLGEESCRCTVALMGRERTSGSVLAFDEGALTLNSGHRYQVCSADGDLELRRLNRGASDADVTYGLRARR